jgi:hypothetical protein
MTKLLLPEKILFGLSALIIVAAGALGYYLIDGEPAIKGLVSSGHNHLMSFAFGAILFGLVLNWLNVSEQKKMWMGYWMCATFLGPIALIYAGFSGQTALLKFTSPIFNGSFVILWFLLAIAIFNSRSKR